jgi:hypothetical protein
MLFAYLLLFAVLALALALLIDWGLGGLVMARGIRAAPPHCRAAGDSWGTALAVVVAMLVSFLAWWCWVY